MELRKIEIELNRHGLYDIRVNGEIVMEMVSAQEIAESVDYITKHPEQVAEWLEA